MSDDAPIKGVTPSFKKLLLRPESMKLGDQIMSEGDWCIVLSVGHSVDGEVPIHVESRDGRRFICWRKKWGTYMVRRQPEAS